MSAERHRNARRRGLVVCDATWDPVTRRAHIAVTGVIGDHTAELEDCAGNTLAEARAVLLAMGVAEHVNDGKRPPRLVFRTDAQGLVKAQRFSGEQGVVVNQIRRYLARFRQWELEWSRRTHTGAAHVAARRARNGDEGAIP